LIPPYGFLLFESPLEGALFFSAEVGRSFSRRNGSAHAPARRARSAFRHCRLWM